MPKVRTPQLELLPPDVSSPAANLAERHDRLSAMLAASTELLFSKDRDGHYQMINPAAARFIGKPAGEIIGQTDADLFTPELATRITATDRQVMATGIPETLDCAVIDDGASRVCRITIHPCLDRFDQITGVIGTGQPITSRPQPEPDRRQRNVPARRLQAELDQIYRSVPSGLACFDCDLRCVRINEPFAAMNAEPAPVCIGRTIREIIPDLADQLEPLLLRAFSSKRPLLNANVRTTDPADRGAARHWRVSCFPVVDDDGHALRVIVVAADAHVHQATAFAGPDCADRSTDLSRRVIEMQEQERRHLARELHDEIGQVLTAISVNLYAAQQKCGVRQAPYIADSIRIVDQALQQVRNLSLDLRPALLDDLGLVAALRWYADRQAQRAGFVLHFVVQAAGNPLSPELATACFRIAQEALTNIVRHARAKQVWLQYRESADEVNLSIRDNGAGFDLAKARAATTDGAGQGLQGMYERAALLGGSIDIKSRPSCGTTIRVRFPLSSSGRHRSR